MNDYLRRYLSSYKNVSAPSFQFCDYLNISVCPASEANHVSIAYIVWHNIYLSIYLSIYICGVVYTACSVQVMWRTSHD